MGGLLGNGVANFSSISSFILCGFIMSSRMLLGGGMTFK